MQSQAASVFVVSSSWLLQGHIWLFNGIFYYWMIDILQIKHAYWKTTATAQLKQRLLVVANHALLPLTEGWGRVLVFISCLLWLDFVTPSLFYPSCSFRIQWFSRTSGSCLGSSASASCKQRNIPTQLWFWIPPPTCIHMYNLLSCAHLFPLSHVLLLGVPVVCDWEVLN